MTIAGLETFKAAWIESLKQQPTITSLIAPREIRELEYQSTDWTYPCIRVGIEFLPAIIRCGPEDANVEIEVYSAEKSSKEAAHIASIIEQLYHGIPFTELGVRFSTVIVRRVHKPDRTVPAWMVKVDIFCQGVGI